MLINLKMNTQKNGYFKGGITWVGLTINKVPLGASPTDTIPPNVKNALPVFLLRYSKNTGDPESPSAPLLVVL